MPDEGVLSGQKIAFAEDQLDDEVRQLLSASAKKLGASVVARTDADLLIVHPSASTYTLPSHDDPQHVPYHWLEACAASGSRVDPDALDPPEPFLVAGEDIESPGRKPGDPLRIYVSLNVWRNARAGETATAARDAVASLVRQGGAIVVDRRAAADLLVVDRMTKAAQKLVDEMKRNERHWQRVVERKWVERCIKDKSMLPFDMEPVSDSDSDDARSDDSFARDDPAAFKRGPGRPTGKPRIEYTPHDDDFLCRYLAKFHPGGSWGSRKTYEIMVKHAGEFPIADRHSAQSWHERFKKNSSAFTRRVERFIREGLDDELKTREEQTRDQERKEREARREAPAGASQAQEGPSRKGKEKEADKQAPSAGGKRKLVDLLSDDESTKDTGKGKDRTAAGSGIRRAARVEAARDAVGVQSSPTRPMANPQSTRPGATAPAQAEAATSQSQGAGAAQVAPQATEAPPAPQNEAPADVFQIDESILPRLATPPVADPVIPATVPARARRSPSPPPARAASDPPEAQSETQALLGNFRRAQKRVRLSQGGVIEGPSSAAPAVPTSRQAEHDSASTTLPAETAPTLATARIASGTDQESTPVAASAPVKVVPAPPASAPPAAQAVGSGKPVDGAPPPAPAPAVAAPEVPARPPAATVPLSAPAPVPSTAARPSTPPRKKQRASAPVVPQSPTSPTSPSSPWRSRMDAEIAAATRRRQRSSSIRSDRHRVNRLDTVVARTAAVLTPVPPPAPVPETPAPPRPSRPSRPPSPPLTDAQRSQRILTGQQRAAAVVEEYRLRIAGYMRTYGITRAEVFNTIDEAKRANKDDGLNWAVVERHLESKFGR